MNLKVPIIFFSSLLASAVFVMSIPVVRASEPPVLVDVVEIVDPAPFIIHTNILPGDTFPHSMTVKNLTGTTQNVEMKLDIDPSQGIVSVIPFELEEQLFVKIERVGTGFLDLPGGGQEKTLQELSGTLIDLGLISGGSTQVYNISFVFNRDAGNEYQNTKVYFNVTLGLEVPETKASLQIRKTNDSVAPEAPGSEVEYTLQVTAQSGDVDDVTLTDLPPAGFVYIPGSGDGAPFIHEYASPGVWNLGNIAAGETKTVTYKTKIDTTQDDGLYRDIAFARGSIGEGESIFAIDPNDSDNFVGTEVAVVTPSAQTVKLDEKSTTDTTTKKKIKQVLGASTFLPSTGASLTWIVFALVTLVIGLGMIFFANRKNGKVPKAENGPTANVLLWLLFSVSIVAFPAGASAATDPHISVRIEAPESPSIESVFKIGFVTLDIEGRNLSAQCYETGDIPVTTEYAPKEGGNSGSCLVDVSDGTYQFFVKARFDDGEGGGAENTSETVTVVVKAGTPDTPFDYHRGKNSCGVTFTTANDTLTTGVELYRSTDTTFVADASTYVSTLAIGPNTDGTIVDTNTDCGGGNNFYAIRAISATGAGSGFVGDENVTVKHKTKTKTIVETIAGSVSGALPVSGGISGTQGTGGGDTGGAVQGAETENGQTSGGSVLGEETMADGTNQGGFGSWIMNNPWRSFFILLAVLILGYFGYQYSHKKYDQSAE